MLEETDVGDQTPDSLLASYIHSTCRGTTVDFVHKCIKNKQV